MYDEFFRRIKSRVVHYYVWDIKNNNAQIPAEAACKFTAGLI